MKFKSTRGSEELLFSAQAISQGIAKDGGLFVPIEIPQVDLSEIALLEKMSYAERAEYILKFFLTDYTAQELQYCTSQAYSQDNFSEPIAPVVSLEENLSVLELWHGKTSAFKDMALQILPYLLTVALKKETSAKKLLILVATSGDTGKAALEGFKDVAGTEIIVFYPVDGVSDIQKLQMTTQAGENVHVFAVKGNFDDAQTGVKEIFANQNMAESIEKLGYQFSSANSINWGRLVPQIVYYFSAYIDLVKQKSIKLGEQVNFCVPTGNFGNILAGYYAELMGLPVHKFICASNLNNVLTDFINTGEYNRNREFYKTNSPSMDILISSNLERFLHQITGDSSLVAKYMQELSQKGYYKIAGHTLEKIKEVMQAYCFDEAQTEKAIADVYATKKYLLDTHTAVAYLAAEKYQQETADKTHTVVLSTASAFKFSQDVLKALKQDITGLDSFQQNDLLEKLTAQPTPARIKSLKTAKVLHEQIIDKQEMLAAIKAVL